MNAKAKPDKEATRSSRRQVLVLAISALFLLIGGAVNGARAQAPVAALWVAVDGNDTNDGSRDAPFRTINKAIGAVVAGGTIHIRRGTYIESSKHRAFGADPYTLGIAKSGTPDNPITISAAPGDERRVIIDCEGTKGGLIITGNNGYIHIRHLVFRNMHINGIYSPGRINEVYAEPGAFLSRGVVIEGCEFYDVMVPKGKNGAFIGCWASKDWIIRNNKFQGARSDKPNVVSGHGIMAYGVVNCLIEHNEFDVGNMGVYWKDHFLQSEENPIGVFTSEIRFNRMKVHGTGLRVCIRAENSVRAGSAYFHHNIVYGYQGSNSYGVRYLGALALRSVLRVEHNIFAPLVSDGKCVALTGLWSSIFRGNIVLQDNLYLETRKGSARVTESDHNIFAGTGFRVFMDRYSDSARQYTALPSWQALLASQHASLDVDNPDSNSVMVSKEALFTDRQAHDYTHAAGSPALGFMPDGSNAGCYQFGSEVIGRQPEFTGSPQ